jgi:flagellar motility protein MotE (MotC chaperone)
MAKAEKNNGKAGQDPRTQGRGISNGKKNGFALGLIAFLTAVAIIAAVFGGVFFIVVHNNVRGLGEKYRKEIQAVPVLRLALPKKPDPDNPEYMTEAELRQKYLSLAKLNDELQKRLDAAKEEIEQLKTYKENYDSLCAEIEGKKKILDEREKKLENDIEQYNADKIKLDELVAMNDKEGFKAFFEKIDGENAKKLYSEILKSQKEDDEAKKYAAIYESMEPDAAAKILMQMGNAKMDLIVGILRYVKKETAAEILASMEPSFASGVAEKLSEPYFAVP